MAITAFRFYAVMFAGAYRAAAGSRPVAAVCGAVASTVGPNFATRKDGGASTS